MARDRLDTSELEGALGPLAATPPPLTKSAPAAAAAPPPVKAGERSSRPLPSGLFDPVKVQGEDEIGRAVAEDKVAILRRKVIALENRISQIRDTWSARDAELDAALTASQREKKAREDAEAANAKLNAFVAMKKAEVETYHERVQEALREQAKRESDAARTHAEREKDLIAGASRREQELQDRVRRSEAEMREAMARREQEIQEKGSRREQEIQQAAIAKAQELQQGGARLLKEASDGHVRRERELIEQIARREREMSEALARREKELIDERSRHERNALQDFTRREQELQLRLETVETELRHALERVSATPPPPPPPIEATELEEIVKSLTVGGRAIAQILKGQMPNDLVTEALRDSLKQIKWSAEQIASLIRDLG